MEALNLCVCERGGRERDRGRERERERERNVIVINFKLSNCKIFMIKDNLLTTNYRSYRNGTLSE